MAFAALRPIDPQIVGMARLVIIVIWMITQTVILFKKLFYNEMEIKSHMQETNMSNCTFKYCLHEEIILLVIVARQVQDYYNIIILGF